MNTTNQSRIPLSAEEFIKTLQRLHLFLAIGVFIFLCITIYLVESGGFAVDDALNDMFLYMVPILALVSVFASRLMYSKRVEVLKTLTTLEEKTEGYQAALIVRWALIEGPSLFAVIAFMLTGNYLFGLIALSLLLYLILQRPRLESVLADLALSHNDFNAIRN